MKGYKGNAVGRRKTAVARVFVKEGSGVITVNNKPFEEYFERDTLKMVVMQPLVATDSISKYDFKISVKGSGKSGQAGAVRHGIARVLDELDDTARKIIKPLGYLTRDPRKVERKKFGRHKARKSTQFSKR